MPKTKRKWKVWVEVQVEVEAFDAQVAQKKVAKALAHKVELNPDVAFGIPGTDFHVYDAEEISTEEAEERESVSV